MGIYRQGGKRAMDIVVGGLAAICASPLLVVAGLVSLVVQGRPVLFLQQRAGRDGVPFDIYKLRTMTPATESMGPEITPWGKLLRQSSVDELPQLLNVLGGDMSLVGPRPLHVRYVARYTSEQRRRLDVPPGLTGAAQTAGRNALTWEEKLQLDVEYVDGVTFKNDLQLLLRTAGLVAQPWRSRDTTGRGVEFVQKGALDGDS